MNEGTTKRRGARFIFVGGAHRSGTTLLQNMLDSHPNIFGGPEFLLLPSIIRLRQNLRDSIDRDTIDVICSYEDVDDGVASLIERLLLPIAERNDCVFMSEKSPNNVLVFPELLSIFPGAKTIHIVRDPRAVVSSLLQVRDRALARKVDPPRQSATLRRAITATRTSMEAGLEASKLFSERVLTVVYEDLILNTEEETRRICQFIGVEWSPNMTKPSQFEHLGEKAITSSRLWYQQHSFARDPDPKEIDKWKRHLTTLQAAVVIETFNGIAREFGYEWDSSDDSVSVRIGAKVINRLHARVDRVFETRALRRLIATFRRRL